MQQKCTNFVISNHKATLMKKVYYITLCFVSLLTGNICFAQSTTYSYTSTLIASASYYNATSFDCNSGDMYQDIATDSNTYFYSKNRTGDLTHPMKFDSSHYILADTSFDLSSHTISESANGNTLTLQSFDKNNNVLTSTKYLSNGQPFNRVTNTYNSKNNLINEKIESYYGGNWGTDSLYSFDYNSANLLSGR